MIMRVFDKTLVRAGEIRSFLICAGPVGWEVSEHCDAHVAWRQRHTDWHHVERTLMRFMREIAELRLQGWLEAQSPHEQK